MWIFKIEEVSILVQASDNEAANKIVIEKYFDGDVESFEKRCYLDGQFELKPKTNFICF